ncbi:hypothetical protein JTB14_033183 [Gonioctena quinquepunctata]|nr:hypothetical protein JTB14_033183 [Gonioctena quinquepunctata]
MEGTGLAGEKKVVEWRKKALSSVNFSRELPDISQVTFIQIINALIKRQYYTKCSQRGGMIPISKLSETEQLDGSYHFTQLLSVVAKVVDEISLKRSARNSFWSGSPTIETEIIQHSNKRSFAEIENPPPNNGEDDQTLFDEFHKPDDAIKNKSQAIVSKEDPASIEKQMLPAKELIEKIGSPWYSHTKKSDFLENVQGSFAILQMYQTIYH